MAGRADVLGRSRGRRSGPAFALLLSLILATGCAPEPRDLAQLTVMDSLYVDPVSGTPFTGPVVRHFIARNEGPLTVPAARPEEDGRGEGDSVQLEGTLREGVWDSELVVYHPNGRVRYMGSFTRGARCGPWVENADSTPLTSTYEELVREVESMALYPPCDGAS